MKERARILVVDDDENIRSVLSTVLEEKGYEVDTARNGREAIEKSKHHFYNLVLIDIRLPDMEGTLLLEELKETVPEMVKIILTGYPSLSNAIEAVNKGADRYLVKPVDPEVLDKVIKEHLKKQEEARMFSEEKVAQFIETRARQLGHIPRSH
ncbi:response regulator [Candidatus Bathyarchaeota archaeon]|nr:MAG: response regulator [Candidatus Bathyarchaeota archaeon]